MFWGTNSVGGGLQPFQKVSALEVRRHGAPVPDASAFGPRRSKANDYVPSRYRLQDDGRMESMLTRPVPEHSLSALAEGYGEEARKVRERKVEEAVIASDPSLDASALTPLSQEVDARLNASLALASRTATAVFEASLTTSHVALRSSGMYASVGAEDPITAALTTPTAPSPTYYAVLRLLVAVTRTQLVPDEEGVPAGGGGAGYLAAPHPDRLGPAFPDIVRAEDPAYFAALQQTQKELAFAKSDYMEGLRKAYAAVGDDLSYCFDRKTLPSSPSTGSKQHSRGGLSLKRRSPVTTVSPPGKGTNGSGGYNPSHSTTSLTSPSTSTTTSSPPRQLTLPPGTALGALIGASPLASMGGQGSAMAEYKFRSGRKLLSYGNETMGELHPARDIAREQGRGFLSSTGTTTSATGTTSGSSSSSSSSLGFPERRIVTVGEATGNLACAVPEASGVTVNNALSKQPLKADAAIATLRWSMMQRVVMEQRRSRCTHLTHWLAREIEREAGRQTRLRRGAGKYAIAAAKASGEDWTQYATLVAGEDPPEDGSKEEEAGGKGMRVGGKRPARAPAIDIHLVAGVSERFTPKVEGKLGGGAGESFTATDLARVRFTVERERAEAMDSVMRILDAYRYVPASSSAMYLKASLRETQELGRATAAVMGKEFLEEMDGEEEEEEEGEGERAAAAAAAAADSPHTKARKEASAIALLKRLDPGGMAQAFSLPSPLPRPPGEVINGSTDPRPPRTLQPPSDYFVKHGGARPYNSLDELQEEPFGANALGGLSMYNLRPAGVRAAVRGAVIQPYPGLLDGFQDSLEGAQAAAEAAREEREMAEKAEALVSKGIEAEEEEERRKKVEEEEATARAAASDGAGGAGAGEAKQGQQGHVAGGGAAAVGGGRRRKQYPPPRKGVPEWLKAIRPGKKSAAAGGGGITSTSTSKEEAGGDEGSGGGGGAKQEASFDSLDFQQSEDKLKRWALGGRALWEELALQERDISQIRESTDINLGIVTRLRKEPTSRFSHLLGRYMPSETFRISRAYESALTLRPRAVWNVHSLSNTGSKGGSKSNSRGGSGSEGEEG